MMKLTIPFSDKKVEMMGEAAALLFKLKPDRHGCYRLRAGQQVTKLGLGRTILGIVEETAEFTECEMHAFLKARRIKA